MAVREFDGIDDQIVVAAGLSGLSGSGHAHGCYWRSRRQPPAADESFCAAQVSTTNVLTGPYHDGGASNLAGGLVLLPENAWIEFRGET